MSKSHPLTTIVTVVSVTLMLLFTMASAWVGIKSLAKLPRKRVDKARASAKVAAFMFLAALSLLPVLLLAKGTGNDAWFCGLGRYYELNRILLEHDGASLA